MIRIEPRQHRSRTMDLGIPVLSAVIALAFAAIPLMAAGANPITAYGEMVKGVFGSVFALSEMLTRATPLIFTGLAAALAFRAKLWNIGAEGQLYLGAMAAVAVGAGWLDLPGLVLVPLIVILGAAAGAAGMAVPTYLKSRFGADEVVTTLLLNFIILIFLQMMLEGPLKDPMGLGWPQSAPILDQGMLPPLMDRMRVHSGLILALVLAAVAQFMLARSVWGFRLRAVGENAAAARHAGINVNRSLFGVAIISGGLAGLAGVSEVAGLKGYLTADLSPGFGYTGIVVAMLAGLSPVGVVIAALFIASVFVGADSMSRAMGVSSFLADLVVSMSLLCVLVGGFIARYRIIRSGTGRAAS
ncbi:ABC transporter permease [Ruegeria pomeroyi]|uniref:ABC transporter permease n=2 Tax=Ruegeria TaxID=97050 RepID=A0A9Q3WE73_9RHOB|nr:MULTISPECIES: ABC transporter permease [Ruegeria]MCE8512735.1 ABC transporter permease [Ruegeria pomeroyi]MCE8526094.1 ABC transporter permease [Ruegeria pomeroyi]MCE8531347.1 ABC transporter permease [Ruegeria pomeroyi]MCE8537539.1 ABC transporter permease [Ruegeria pomeroyi]MCE8554113.1 ABC transporter permease [Ruegeria pomeroyi]